MTVAVEGRPVYEGVVRDDGSLVVPSSEIRSLGLAPGDEVAVRILVPRRDMYGALADKIPDISLEEFEESSRDAWKGRAHG
jgi:hypothetical protein